jgi:hypothetical protein
MTKKKNDLLKVLSKGHTPLTEIEKNFKTNAIRVAVQAGHCFNEINKNGIGILKITGVGLKALKKPTPKKSVSKKNTEVKKDATV